MAEIEEEYIPGEDKEPRPATEDLVCPLSMVSGQAIRCLGKDCQALAWKANVCTFVSTFNTAGFFFREASRLIRVIEREIYRRRKKEKGE